MNVKYLLFLFLLPVVLSAQSQDSVRYSSIGFSIGNPHQIAYPTDNSQAYYLTNGPLFYTNSYTFAFSGQWYRPNRWGFGLDVGLRQYFAVFRESRGQALFGGKYRGDFQSRSGYIAPHLIYNRQLSEADVLNFSLGAEVHASFGATAYQYEQGTFFLDPASGFVLARLGIEYSRKLSHDFRGSFYLNLTQGLDETATLSLAEDTGFEAEHLGSYWGTGFEFGVRVSVCWACGE